MSHLKQTLSIDPHSFDNWTACCVGFFGFLHGSEFLTPETPDFDPSVHLTVTEVSYLAKGNPLRIELCIKASKTDQLCKGAIVALGSSSTDIFPVAAVLDYQYEATAQDLSLYSRMGLLSPDPPLPPRSSQP
jgi:hypothetical protein